MNSNNYIFYTYYTNIYIVFINIKIYYNRKKYNIKWS